MAIELRFIMDNNGSHEIKTEIVKKRKAKKRNKGKNLLLFPDEYVVIDIETTGLSPKCDHIIELAAVRIKNGEPVDTYTTLVQPPEIDYDDLYDDLYDDEYDEYEVPDAPIYISDFISQLTGITNEMLIDAPRIDDVIGDYISFIGDSIIMGQNVNFDINFIYDNALEVLGIEFKNNFCDLLRITRRLFPDFENHKLETIAEMFGIEFEGHHRAEVDCIVTSKCFEYCRNYVKDNDIVLDFYSEYYADKVVKPNEIEPKKTEFDTTHPLYGKYVVFTGTLERMKRQDAAQLVADFGGHPQNGVTKQTNFLVLGNNDYCMTIKDGKSTKQKKAESLILRGQDLKILPEDVFYDMISEE